MFLLVLISKQIRGFLPPVDKYQTEIIDLFTNALKNINPKIKQQVLKNLEE